MAIQKQIKIGIAAFIGMLILILDAKTALSGAQAGLELCYRTVIPSLFPFIVMSILISSSLTGIHLPVLRPISKLCGIPRGAESLFLIGILGGYPVGAQCIYNAYKSKSIHRQNAKRLLGFCNNAGPAFIFGMMGNMFARSAAPWALWGIHILSAVVVGCILPERDNSVCRLSQKQPLTVPQAPEKAIKTMCSICGWIIIFRVFIAFLQRWFLWLLPHTLQVNLIALLELSNGCFEMYNVACQGTRFILCSGILAFGGVCILMQTHSVTADLGLGMYFPGKILQTVISILLACLTQKIIFPKGDQFLISNHSYVLLALICFVIIAIICLRKKVVAFFHRLVYTKNTIFQH